MYNTNIVIGSQKGDLAKKEGKCDTVAVYMPDDCQLLPKQPKECIDYRSYLPVYQPTVSRYIRLHLRLIRTSIYSNRTTSDDSAALLVLSDETSQEFFVPSLVGNQTLITLWYSCLHGEYRNVICRESQKVPIGIEGKQRNHTKITDWPFNNIVKNAWWRYFDQNHFKTDT